MLVSNRQRIQMDLAILLEILIMQTLRLFSKIHQHVDFPTRGNNIFDFVYTNHKEVYRVPPLPHIGLSDHITIMLRPAYRPRVKVTKPVLKQVRVWPEEASFALQDCFDTTDWQVFRQAATCYDNKDIEKYTDTVTSYITKCIENVSYSRTITTRANRKPWLTGEVHKLLRARNAAFRAGDVDGRGTTRANLSRGNRKAKQDHTKKLTSYFRDS